MKRRILRPLAVMALALLTMTLATCISAEEKDYVVYDAASDEFRMLMVLTDIQAKDADDLEFLAAFHANRDHVIAPAIPGAANVFPLFGFSLVRMAEKQFAPVNLYATRPGSLDTAETMVALDTIKVTPGTFFVEGGKLGFFQAVAVPGKTIDAALDELSKAAQTDDMTKGLQEELDRRAAGGKTITWEKAKEKLLKEMSFDTPAAPATEPAATEEAEFNPGMIFDAETLKNLKQAAADKSLRIRREKQSLVLALPLSARDTAGVVDLVKSARGRLDDMLKNSKAMKELGEESADKLHGLQVAREIGQALSVTAGDKGVVISLDLLKATQMLAAMPVKRIDMNSNDGDPAATKPAPQDVIGYLRQHKVALDEKLTAAQIVKDFQANTLKGYPSAAPVKPGQGIVKPQEKALP